MQRSIEINFIEFDKKIFFESAKRDILSVDEKIKQLKTSLKENFDIQKMIQLKDSLLYRMAIKRTMKKVEKWQ